MKACRREPAGLSWHGGCPFAAAGDVGFHPFGASPLPRFEGPIIDVT
jgi:hypothetical protein